MLPYSELTVASSQAPPQPLTHAPFPQAEERVGTAKTRKLIVQGEDSLISEGKRKEKQVMQRGSLTASHKQTDDQQVSEQQPPWKVNPPLLLPEFYCRV